jgi:hypothetical protein
MQGKFDFRTTSGTGKWSTQQETYRLNALRLSNAGSEDAYPFEVLETKLKVRGRGKALILRWESSTGKDFELLGWSIPIEVETQE